ncbi:MAG: hypothetical protein FWD68_06775 [Alphaproteobacteria bacterium]|nr:hypothetical protein [Alphaproteobacteria bacterium]
MALIGRVLMIMIGFVVAGAVAGAILVATLVMPELRSFGNGVVENDALNVLDGVGFVAAMAFAVVPALVLIAISEALAIRSLLAHAFAGGVLGLVSYFKWVSPEGGSLQFGFIMPHHLQVLAAAGVVAGMVYWLITGRGAGNWRPRPAAVYRPPPPMPSGSIAPREPK